MGQWSIEVWKLGSLDFHMWGHRTVATVLSNWELQERNLSTNQSEAHILTLWERTSSRKAKRLERRRRGSEHARFQKDPTKHFFSPARSWDPGSKWLCCAWLDSVLSCSPSSAKPKLDSARLWLLLSLVGFDWAPSCLSLV